MGQRIKNCETLLRIHCLEGLHRLICDNEIQYFDFLGKGYNSNLENLPDSWWFKDLLLLRIDHFIEVIASCKRKGIRSKLVGSCIACWTTKWLSRISLEFDNVTQKHLTIRLYKVTIKSLISVLPEDAKISILQFCASSFQVGAYCESYFELLNKLERRIASMLVGCRAKDLLVKNYGYGTTIYDVGIVVRVVQAYVSLYSGKFSSRMRVIGRLVDEYLTLAARDDNLPANIFKSLVEALPKRFRLYDGYLDRAIDMYLKAHSSLTEEERSDICRAMEYEKLMF